MVENGLMNDANGRLFWPATLRGRPGPTNIARDEVIVIPASNTGEATAFPFSRLLPDSQATTSPTKDVLSPRTVNSRSLFSKRTGTLNSWRRKANTWLPDATSLGEATARLSTGCPDEVTGIAALTSAAGSRLK